MQVLFIGMKVLDHCSCQPCEGTGSAGNEVCFSERETSW